MRSSSARRLAASLLGNSTLVLLAAVVVVFALLSPDFLRLDNLVNILDQSAALGITAIGMTFVLLIAGIDLSVGAAMFVGAAIVGKLVLSYEAPVVVALLAMLAVGGLWGASIGLAVTWLRVAPFIVTLAALFVGRGLGLLITQTRAMNLPDAFRELATSALLGVPAPVVLFACVALVAHLTLTSTPFGRQLYAVGEDPVRARKAGVAVHRVTCMAYVACGLAAALGGMVSLARLSAVSPTFGESEEFRAIAAAVLGGTSLFGGRGTVLPGTVLGALLIQTIRNGLNVLDADPYCYPIITGTTIFVAVLIDCLRQRQLRERTRRRIRPGQ